MEELRLIDANALKEEIINSGYALLTPQLMSTYIDNAQTVEQRQKGGEGMTINTDELIKYIKDKHCQGCVDNGQKLCGHCCEVEYALYEIYCFIEDKSNSAKEVTTKRIDNAPTVESEDNAIQYTKGYQDGFLEGKKLAERPQGEWFVNPHSMVMKCMNCGHEETAKDVGVVDKDKHFCYWCGADMRGKEK